MTTAFLKVKIPLIFLFLLKDINLLIVEEFVSQRL